MTMSIGISGSKLNAKTAARITYETNALMTKMVRTRQMRIDNKTSAPAYAKALESIRKTKALLHKLRSDFKKRLTRARINEKELTETLFEIAEKVHAHALKNYDKGWDYIVECYSATDIVAQLKDANVTSLREALKHFESRVSVRNDIALDHQLEAAAGQ